MKTDRLPVSCVFFAMCIAACSSAVAQDAGPTISTDGGFSIVSADERHSFNLGGRIMWDVDSYDGVLTGDSGRRVNSMIRRARLEMDGDVGENFEYVMSYEMGGREPFNDFHELGLRYTGFRFFDVFVGRGKEPFGLEELTSSKSITTIERNYFTEATLTDSQTHYGVRLDGNVGRLGWSTGLFNPGGNPKKADGSDRFAWTSRVFGAPVLNDNEVLHFGLAYTDPNLDEPTLQPGFELDVAEAGGKLDSAGLLIASDKQYGLEALYINGPFSIQSEFFNKDMRGALGGPRGDVDAWYAQFAWTLTGQRRGYRASSGIADTIAPVGNSVAIELVAKYDSIEYVSEGGSRQKADGVLLGASWYFNENVKFMLNYTYLDSDGIVDPGATADANVIMTRVQIAF